MTYQKTLNYLDGANKTVSKFVTKDWIEIDDKIKIKTTKIKSL